MKLWPILALAGVGVLAYTFGSGTAYASGWTVSNGTLTKGKKYRVSVDSGVTVPPIASDAALRSLFSVAGVDTFITAVYAPGVNRPPDWPTPDTTVGRWSFELTAPNNMQLVPVANMAVWSQK